MPDLTGIWSRLAGKHWPEAGPIIVGRQFVSGPDPFGQNLMQSARTKLDLAGFAQCDSGHLWKNVTKSESGVQPEFGTSGSCTPACFQIRCVWPYPDQDIQISSGSVLHNMSLAFFGKKWNWIRCRKLDQDPAWLLLHSGHNWPEPKCFQTGSGMFTGYVQYYGPLPCRVWQNLLRGGYSPVPSIPVQTDCLIVS